jgi:hypothetical protein
MAKVLALVDTDMRATRDPLPLKASRLLATSDTALSGVPPHLLTPLSSFTRRVSPQQRLRRSA